MGHAVLRVPIPVLQEGVTNLQDPAQGATTDVPAVFGGRHHHQERQAYVATAAEMRRGAGWFSRYREAWSVDLSGDVGPAVSRAGTSERVDLCPR